MLRFVSLITRLADIKKKIAVCHQHHQVKAVEPFEPIRMVHEDVKLVIILTEALTYLTEFPGLFFDRPVFTAIKYLHPAVRILLRRFINIA